MRFAVLMLVFANPTLLYPSLALGQANTNDWDLLIHSGTVIDGSGRSAFQADVAIQGDRIVTVSETSLDRDRASRVIDATGMVVSPGFVDLHAHLDPLLRLPGSESHIRQGVTTALGGPDGGGPWPFEAHLDAVEEISVGMNVGFLVGHNTIRRTVMGLDNRAPTPPELDRMKSIVAKAMEEGLSLIHI